MPVNEAAYNALDARHGPHNANHRRLQLCQRSVRTATRQASDREKQLDTKAQGALSQSVLISSVKLQNTLHVS